MAKAVKLTARNMAMKTPFTSVRRITYQKSDREMTPSAGSSRMPMSVRMP